MKTFSFFNLFTLVCLGLMFVGNAAEAQEAGLKVNFEDVPDEIRIVDGTPEEATFEVQLTNDDGDGVNGVDIDFTAIPAKSAMFLPSNSIKTSTVGGKDGIAQVTVRFIEAGIITVRGTINLDGHADRADLETQGLLDGAFAGHDFKVVEVQTEEVPVYEDVEVNYPDTTKIVVLPPIPCSLHENVPLSQLVEPHLSEIVERIGTEDITPTSFAEIQTHDGLLQAIAHLRDDLGGLAARWDDMDPAADPADPTDMDSPPNMFRVPIVILNVEDLNGWQFDIAYNPQILEVIEVSAGNYAIFEGDFLKQGNAMTFFQDADEVNNAAGEIIRISQTRIATGDEVNNTKADLVPQGAPGWEAEIAGRKPSDSINGADGTGELVSICFRVKEFAEESLGLHNLQLSDSLGNRLDFTTLVHPIVVTHQFAPEDVNRDTVVNIKDLMVVAASLGLAKPINPRADVNNDGIVNALDLVIVAQHINDRAPAVKVREPNMPAPAIPGSGTASDLAAIQGWIDMAHLEDDGSAIFDLGIANLEALLASKRPSQTKLLLNYPNPFNPETWIPYQLAEATEVTISIYAVNGNLVRTLALGHQAVGAYQSKSQAAYWDGRNELGERVASGVYFYTFTAGKFSATGKMLVRK